MQLLSGPGLGPGRYNVILDGSIAAVGRLGSESMFAPDLEASRSHGLDGRVDVDPLEESGPGGLWLAREVDAPPELEVLDRYQFMLRHVEAVLLRNLDLFFGIEQAAEVFEAAKRNATPESLVRMAAVSRALLREGVPLTASESIAAEVTKPDVDGIELPALVERVREMLARAISRVRTAPARSYRFATTSKMRSRSGPSAGTARSSSRSRARSSPSCAAWSTSRLRASSPARRSSSGRTVYGASSVESSSSIIQPLPFSPSPSSRRTSS